MTEQFGLDFISAPTYRQLARREFVMRRAAENIALFRVGFQPWLEKHLDLWECYEAEANAVWNEGFKHYASRTIWELMRHRTRHRERGSEFKLNNNWAPSLARLYLTLYPEREGFFETREAA